MTTELYPADPRFPSAVIPLFAGTPPARQFTVDEYHRMIETGILTENDRVELLDGWILKMSPIGPPHATALNLVAAALQNILPAAWFVRTQSPVTLETSEPEPDLTVVRGRIRDYLSHHPYPADVALLVEVADSTLDFDRLQKRLCYAAAGIAEYWIVNLIDRRLEVFRDPAPAGDYQITKTIDAGGSVELLLGGRPIASVQVDELLP
jgi:Uma2 family endonuclease